MPYNTSQPFRPQSFRADPNVYYDPTIVRIHGVPVNVTGYAMHPRGYSLKEQRNGAVPDTMGARAPYHSSLVPGNTYQVNGPNFQAGTQIQTVNGVSFMCSAPINARAPSSLSNAKHIIVEDASACQLECMDAGKNKCNVYSFKPSDFAPNCTIGYAAAFTKALESTQDPSSIAGYCVPISDAATSIYYPPFH